VVCSYSDFAIAGRALIGPISVSASPGDFSIEFTRREEAARCHPA
jgi:hypothetical protein